MFQLRKASEVAKVLGIDRRKIRLWCTTGMLKHTLLPNGNGSGMYFIEQKDIEKIMRKHNFPKKAFAAVGKLYKAK